MPKVTAARIALTALIALALTGCSGAADEATSDPRSFAQSVPSETPEVAPEPSPSTEPLIAAPDAEMTEAEAEAAYLVTVRERLSKIRTQIPNASDEQLLIAARDACERLEAGESGENMTLIEGEDLTNGYYMDSGAIIISARLTMCPIEK